MRLLIYGSREFAKTVAELIRHCGHEATGMVDDYNSGRGIVGTFQSIVSSHGPSEYGFALGIGYSNIPARWKIWQRLRAAGYCLPPLIHPRAYVADTANVGLGSMIMAGAIVDVRVRLGNAVVIWPGACINHDTTVGDNSFVSPNATICGSATVGEHSFIGAGAAIADHCEVPASSFVNMHMRYTGAPK